jgi:hypothetical protein
MTAKRAATALDRRVLVERQGSLSRRVVPAALGELTVLEALVKENLAPVALSAEGRRSASARLTIAAGSRSGIWWARRSWSCARSARALSSVVMRSS